MRETRGAEQAGGNQVVYEIRDSHEPRSGEQSQTSAQKFLAQLLRLRLRCGGRQCVRGVGDPRFSGKRHRSASRLEQREMHNWKQRGSAGSRKVIERLLLQSEREAHGERYRHFAHAVFQTTAERAHIRDKKFALRVVVSVIPGAARKNERSLDAPTRSGTELKAASGQQRLGDRVLRALDAPRAQVVCNHGRRETPAEFVLQSGIARSIEIFLDRWAKQQIPRGVSGDERGVAPRASDRELDVGGEVAGMQVLIRKWPCFMNRAAADRNPVVERTGGEIEELPEQILIHVRRRSRIAANSELQTSVERNGVRPEMQDRRNSTIQNGVERVAVLNYALTGEQELTHGITLTDEAGDGGQVPQAHAIVGLAQTLI